MPLGIHDCDLNEIEAAFVYNERRRSIWSGFSAFLNLVIPIPEFDLLYIDGGFVTNNEKPKDIDVVLELPDMGTFFRVMNANQILQGRSVMKNMFLADVYFVFPAARFDLREYFQYVRPEDAVKRGLEAGSKKGILRISLRQ